MLINYFRYLTADEKKAGMLAKGLPAGPGGVILVELFQQALRGVLLRELFAGIEETR